MILTVDPGTAGERHEPRICALLWSSDADPRLLAAEHFRSIHEFKAWLIGQRALWLGADLAVRWTPALVANAPLAAVIADVLVGQAASSSDELPAHGGASKPLDRSR